MDQPIPSARELLTALNATAHALALCMGNASRSLITRILVLRTIAAHGGRLRHVDIIREIGCSGPDLSALLDRLVDDRLVAIRAVDSGGRPASDDPSPDNPETPRAPLPPTAREAVITRSGRRVLEAIESRYDLRADLVFAPITPSERVFLLRVLDKIRVAAEAMWLRTRASLSRRALDDDGLWADATTTPSDDEGPPSPEVRRADERMPLAYELAYEDAQVRFFVEMLELLETADLANPTEPRELRAGDGGRASPVGRDVRRRAASSATSAPHGVPIWTSSRPIPSS